MRYYPVNLDIKARECLVVGGGSVAARKVKTLLECGAYVTVISPCFSEDMEGLSQRSGLKMLSRSYRSGDLGGFFLVIGATDDMELNLRISRDAEEKGMLCNIADVPRACNFILPSIIRQGDLVITISTSGKSPAFSKHLRRRLQDAYGVEYAEFLKLMGAVRRRLLAEDHAPEAHKEIFNQLIQKNLVELIRRKESEKINRILFEVLGRGFDYETLMAEADSCQEAGR